MKDMSKKTKVKFKFNVKETIEKVRADYAKVKEKISANIKSGDLKKINKQSIKYYSMLFLMLFVAAVATYSNIKSYKEANKEEYKTYVKEKSERENNIQKSEKSPDNESEKEEKNEKENEEVIPVTSPQYITSESSITYVAKEKSENNLPVDGVIKREYSMDKVVYYESLEVWKTHSGVDIVCTENCEVRSALDGKVVGIYNDNTYGYSVVVESGDYTCVYSSLGENVLVSIGNKVKMGDLLGYAGKCAAEKELGYHVHFEVMKDGEYVNPESLGIK